MDHRVYRICWKMASYLLQSVMVVENKEIIRCNDLTKPMKDEN